MITKTPITIFLAGVALAQLPLHAGAQSPELSLKGERAAAKAAGLELSIDALSAPMPPIAENAAPLYKKFAELQDKKALAKKGSQDDLDIKILDSAQANPMRLTDTDWLNLDRALKHCAEELALVRRAAMLPKCVVAVREYSDPVQFPDDAEMRSAVRLLSDVAFWEAHSNKPTEAIADMALGFRVAAQINSHDTMVNHLIAGAVDGITAGGFRGILRICSSDAATCKAVEVAIAQNWRPRALSSALKIEAAIAQDFIDQFLKSAPDPRLDAYGAFQLHEMREAISCVDLPYSKSAPLLEATAHDVETKYPAKGELPTPFLDFSGAVFQRDSFANQVNIARVAAAVLAYHAEHGAFPTALIDALPNPPTDAFDGMPLHYEQTTTGFLLSATHQRPGHKPEGVSFQYPGK